MTRALRSRGVGTLRLPSVGLAKFVAVVVIAASLAGCNYDPAYVDALHGLANVPSTSVPQDVPVIVEQPVALVPSENSAMLLQSVKDYIDSTNGKLGKALMPDYEWADGDPQPMVDGAVNVLRRRYPKAELVDDLATAKKRGFRTTFVIDIQSHHITGFRHQSCHDDLYRDGCRSKAAVSVQRRGVEPYHLWQHGPAFPRCRGDGGRQSRREVDAVAAGRRQMMLRAALVAAVFLLPPFIGDAHAQSSGCASLMSSINQLRAQIPHEPGAAAQDDQRALNTYVGFYNRGCTGGGSSTGFSSGGAGPGNNTAAALGAGAMALGDLADLLDQLDQAERQNAAAKQQAILEEALRDADERAALAKGRAAAAAANATDDAKREAMANPFKSGVNPFAAKPAKPAVAPAPPAKQTASGASQARAAGSGCSSYGPGTVQEQYWGYNRTLDDKIMCSVPNVSQAKCLAQGGDYKPDNGSGKVICFMPIPPTVASGGPAPGQKQPKQLKPLPKRNGPGAGVPPIAGVPAPDSDECTGTRDALGACWIIPPRDLALTPNDDGEECGAYDGHRSRGQCVAPWDDQTPADCINNVGGTYQEADDDHPYSTCAYDAPPNAAITDEGPEDSQSCGDLGGMTHHHGQCWVLGLTHEDCDTVGGKIVDSGGFQYCAYDAAAAAAAAQKNPANAKKEKSLRDRLADSLRNADTQAPGAASPTDVNASNQPATRGQEPREQKVATEIQERKACAALGSNWRYDPTATYNFAANAPPKCFPVFTPGSLKGEPGFTNQDN